MTHAEAFAEWMGNDGQQWDTPEGHPMEEALADATRKETQQGYLTYTTRYEFGDGSAIIISGDCWGIEGDSPFQMADA